eukprot:6183163-Pleurochrysis_carterae.AAC.1
MSRRRKEEAEADEWRERQGAAHNSLAGVEQARAQALPTVLGRNLRSSRRGVTKQPTHRKCARSVPRSGSLVYDDKLETLASMYMSTV